MLFRQFFDAESSTIPFPLVRRRPIEDNGPIADGRSSRRLAMTGEVRMNPLRSCDSRWLLVAMVWLAATPPATAEELHRAWPEARLVVVPDAGHSSREPGIARELVMATERLKASG